MIQVNKLELSNFQMTSFMKGLLCPLNEPVTLLHAGLHLTNNAHMDAWKHTHAPLHFLWQLSSRFLLPTPALSIAVFPPDGTMWAAMAAWHTHISVTSQSKDGGWVYRMSGSCCTATVTVLHDDLSWPAQPHVESNRAVLSLSQRQTLLSKVSVTAFISDNDLRHLFSLWLFSSTVSEGTEAVQQTVLIQSPLISLIEFWRAPPEGESQLLS